MRLYFAAALFSVQEREFNARLAASIEAVGFDVFLPQRDGYEGPLDPDDAEQADVARKIFEIDTRQVLGCDVMLCVLDGRVPDEGMAFEMGLAHGDRLHQNRHRRLIGLSTDLRRGGTARNAMLAGGLDEVYADEESLLQRLSEIIGD
jgi:hypothetical protein